MVTLVLEPETERRIAELAKSQGLSEADFVRGLIESSLDDLDDIRVAVERLDNPLKPLTSAEARKSLGLDG
jgi:predicted DNA-binding protein